MADHGLDELVQAGPLGGPHSAPAVIKRIDEIRRSGHARRISYFMLFRLAMLAGFTVLAGWLSYSTEPPMGGWYGWLLWGTLALGYALTLGFAWFLPRVEDLDRFARIQTLCDILLSALVVHESGGADSGFAFLYLIAVLGAATMGDKRQIWAAAIACASIYGAMSLLQGLGVLRPLTPAGFVPTVPAVELWASVARTCAALLGVTALSSFLNAQLASSVSQVGSLRALNENIVRSLNSGLLTTDANHQVLYFNPAAAQILGLDERSLGTPVGQVMPGVEPLLADVNLDPGSRHDLELHQDDGTVHLGLSIVPLLDDQARRIGSVLNFQDVTKLHELAREVRRNERLAAIGSLAASVAHEIRNPLAAISGCADLLDAAKLAHDDRRLLDIVRREGARLERLITDLLSFTRPKTPELLSLDLARAVTEVRESFVSDPANAALTVRVETGPDPIHVRADPSQITQILWNLLRNAADATGVRGTIVIAVRRDGERVRLTVTDDGPGIPVALADRVFEPFFTTKDDGTGFGLAIVHRIIEEHRGQIRVVTPAGGGTRFVIVLPADTPAGDVPTTAPVLARKAQSS